MLLPALARAQGGTWAEASVNRDTPYAQESVVYTVRVFSPGNLQSVEITPPQASGAALEELDRGAPASEVVRGRRYVVNEYHYVLTPMAPGRLEIGAARLTVRAAAERAFGAPWGSGAGREVALATAPLTLTVLPLPAGASMPLRYLDVQAHWGQEGAASAGEPLTLTVVIKGMGATGERLPSVADALRSPDFKVYPDRPQVDWKWGGGGRELWGRRVESYTVVPAREGSLRFPAIDLDWWDTNGNRASHARVPEKVVPVGAEALARGAGGGVSAPHFMKRLLTEKAFYQFVLPVGGGLALAFLFGWWIGVARVPHAAPEGGPAPVAPPPGPAGAAGALRNHVPEALREAWARALAVLSARARGALGALADRFAGYIPLRVQVWWCTRCAAREAHPEGLCQVVRRFACRHLRMPANASLASIADRIVYERPDAAGTPLRQVFKALDDAAYAGRPLDLRTWRREFRRWLRRSLASPHRSELHQRRRGLPELNP
jgi:hypothetical protein